MPAGCSLHASKHLLGFGVVKISAVYEHTRNFLGVGNILKRIRAEQHHIRNLSFLDRAKLPLHSKEARGIERGSLQRFERREPGCDESLQLFEEGIRLSRFCNQKLEEVEKKIELILADAKGQPRVEPFEEAELDAEGVEEEP